MNKPRENGRDQSPRENEACQARGTSHSSRLNCVSRSRCFRHGSPECRVAYVAGSRWEEGQAGDDGTEDLHRNDGWPHLLNARKLMAVNGDADVLVVFFVFVFIYCPNVSRLQTLMRLQERLYLNTVEEVEDLEEHWSSWVNQCWQEGCWHRRLLLSF